MDYGGQPKLLRELNGKLLLNIIREQGPLSRPALSKLSRLSLPTVNARMRTLLEMGYVNELLGQDQVPGWASSAAFRSSTVSLDTCSG